MTSGASGGTMVFMKPFVACIPVLGCHKGRRKSKKKCVSRHACFSFFLFPFGGLENKSKRERRDLQQTIEEMMSKLLLLHAGFLNDFYCHSGHQKHYSFSHMIVC